MYIFFFFKYTSNYNYKIKDQDFEYFNVSMFIFCPWNPSLDQRTTAGGTEYDSFQKGERMKGYLNAAYKFHIHVI